LPGEYLQPDRSQLTTARFSSLSPELSLLLLLLEDPGDAESGAVAAALHSVDKAAFRDLCLRHRLTGLAAHRLAQAGVPPQKFDGLRADADALRRQGLVMFAALVRLVHRLNESEIPCLVYKGPVLSELAYHDPTLRNFVDLDLLLPRAQLRRAVERLTTAGLAPSVPLPDNEAYFTRWGNQFELADDRADIHVELHWELEAGLQGSPLGCEELVRRSQTIDVGGVSLRTLSAPDQLLMLAIHAAKHRWLPLEPLIAFGRLVEAHPQLDWAATLRLATDSGTRRRFLLTMALTKSFTAAAFPEWLLDSAEREPGLDALRRQVEDDYFADKPYREDLPERLGELRWEFAVRERRRDAVEETVKRLVWPRPEDWAAVRLPQSIYWAYYGVRPVRLAGKFGRQGLVRARGRLGARAPARG